MSNLLLLSNPNISDSYIIPECYSEEPEEFWNLYGECRNQIIIEFETSVLNPVQYEIIKSTPDMGCWLQNYQWLCVWDQEGDEDVAIYSSLQEVRWYGRGAAVFHLDPVKRTVRYWNDYDCADEIDWQSGIEIFDGTDLSCMWKEHHLRVSDVI